MWYVIQIFTGEEEIMKQLCERRIPEEIINRCFIPKYQQERRYEGQWHKEEKILFPGYLFIDTEAPAELGNALKKTGRFTRLLGDSSCLQPLSQAETAFLQKFGGEDQVVEMSYGILENATVTITDGPMKGMEGCIRKINRHKRWAEIEVHMFGQLVKARVGLGIVEKKTTASQGAADKTAVE